MNSKVYKYIESIIFDYIESVSGDFYPDKKSFIENIKKQSLLYYPHLSNDNDIKILFTCFGNKEFMNIAFIGPLSNSKYDILIPRKIIDREIKLNYLLES